MRFGLHFIGAHFELTYDHSLRVEHSCHVGPPGVIVKAGRYPRKANQTR